MALWSFSRKKHVTDDVGSWYIFATFPTHSLREKNRNCHWETMIQNSQTPVQRKKKYALERIPFWSGHRVVQSLFFLPSVVILVYFLARRVQKLLQKRRIQKIHKNPDKIVIRSRAPVSKRPEPPIPTLCSDGHRIYPWNANSAGGGTNPL